MTTLQTSVAQGYLYFFDYSACKVLDNYSFPAINEGFVDMRYSNNMLKLLGYNEENGSVSEVITVFKLRREQADVFSQIQSTFVAVLTSSDDKCLL